MKLNSAFNAYIYIIPLSRQQDRTFGFVSRSGPVGCVASKQNQSSCLALMPWYCRDIQLVDKAPKTTDQHEACRSTIRRSSPVHVGIASMGCVHAGVPAARLTAGRLCAVAVGCTALPEKWDSISRRSSFLLQLPRRRGLSIQPRHHGGCRVGRWYCITWHTSLSRRPLIL